MTKSSSFPRISIVTPSFNQGKYIEQTILSIVGQGYTNLEYIIIDGGSTDNTLDIIKKYADKITYWVSEPDRGQSDAINKGLSHCTGDIFNWINSDDYLEADSLFKIALAFTKNPHAEVVCGYARMFNDKDDSTLVNHRCRLFATTEETMVNQKNDQQGMFYKLSVLRQLGPLNETLHYVMDLELWFRYLVARGQTKFVFIDDLLAHFRVHAMSKTAQHEVLFREEEKMLWKHMLTQLKIDDQLVNWFATSKTYFPVVWYFEKVQPSLLKSNLLRYHFYHFYKSGNKRLAKMAFAEMAKNKQVKLSFHYLAIFIKLFVVNFSIRKHFN